MGKKAWAQHPRPSPRRGRIALRPCVEVPGRPTAGPGDDLPRWRLVRIQHRYPDGQGIGGALMAAILAEASTRGLLHVTVHSGRRAVDFYRRNGFSHHRQILLWEPAHRAAP
ncbi:GNAT family N-acetyltransferase [Micromonospora andamanensis]|uniref:GNAT family N-acetyltransferase n=1 Tax=Micromonospora andamanensis TaxID=1287068 RepID=UPI002342D4B7|nr:GNAT family N-acetyltransferase [Micromonospora andamanensis]